MFSVTQPKNRTAAPKNSHIMQPQRGFAVRVFKGPTLSSFPYTATAKFDVGYRPTVNDPRQAAQNWGYGRAEPARPPVSNPREPPKPSRFGSWTENRSRDATRTGAAAHTYADFIYERSLSSKSDIYSNSENDTASTTTFTPSSVFSPALSADSTVTSTPSQAPYQSPTTSASTATTSPPRHPFPLHIPALAQAQSAIRGLFVHPNGDIGPATTSPTPVPPAPATRPAVLPDVAASPPRFVPPEAPARPTSPIRVPLSTSPQPASFSSSDYFPPPPSESEPGEAELQAQRNAQYNAAQSSYYQAGPRPEDTQQDLNGGGYGDAQRDPGAQAPRSREQSPECVWQMGSTGRSVASSSFPTESSDQGRGVYESSSIVTDPPTLFNLTTAAAPARPPPAASPPRAPYVSSESSSTTAVESETRWRDLHGTQVRPVPVSQLVEIDVPGDRERAARERVLSDPGRYEELRGLNILSDRQPYTRSQRSSPSAYPEIPAVVRSDDSGSGGASPSQRARRVSGNLWSSLPQLPNRRSASPSQLPPRPSSTPPLPRIDTSRVAAPPPPPEARQAESNARILQQSPSRRDPSSPGQPQPLTAPPINSSRSRTPVGGPRVLPAEPQRRRSDGDQPMSSSPGLLKRTSAIFHKSPVPEPPPRPTRPGALPLDPQRRRSDGFQSVVPPRPTTPAPPGAAPRNVRWNENLVCPSPIFPSQRRKGWYNRRGDQLWTNDGAYRPAPAGQEFPPDLRDYPSYGTGWMNEDGVRIDMGHRMIPKAPLRSALKQARGPIIQVEQGN